MGGGGSKSSSKSYSGSGQKWARPFATSGAGQVQSVFNQSQPGLQRLTSLTNDTLLPQMQAKFTAGLEGSDAARNYNLGILNGPFGSNPQLQGMIDRSNADIMDNVNGNFSLAGRYGSGAHAGVLGREIANNEMNFRFNDYLAEQQRRAAAAESLTGANQQDYNQILGTIGMGAELPYTGTNNLANSLGALFAGGTEKSKSKQGGGFLNGLMGAAGSIGSAAIMASARELKADIEEIGLWDGKDGLKRYRYYYRNDPAKTVHEGVMADEVKKLRPHAYVPNFVGDKPGVNYAAL